LTATHYKRDRVFWLIALQTGVFGIFMGGFGPAIPLLQSDQGTSAAVAGLHGTALGIAAIIAGYINAPLVHHFGRYKSLWIGSAIFNIGAFSFVIFPSPWQTIPAILITGIGVSTIINNAFVYLTEHYNGQAPSAVMQANGVNSFFFLLGNFIIGILAGTSISWRLGLLLCIPFAIALYYFLGRSHVSVQVSISHERQSGSLPIRYWLSWLALFFSIAGEFAIQFWSAALVRERTGLSAATATTLVLAFPLGMAIGRWFGATIAPRLGIDARLRLVMILQLLGFIAFWFSTSVLLSFLMLLLVGLGTSVQFALSTLRMLRIGFEKPDLAMGLSSLGAGIAIAGSPLALGILADNFGIVSGYLMVPVLFSCALLLVTLVPLREGER
jgi:predicted MFS family arabinose efflux permease